MSPPDKVFLFIAGLHRSGTSILHRCLADHPEVSGFSGTGVPEDEGQHLQSVFPPGREYGGAGLFGFAAAAHMTEEDASPEAAEQLWREWSPHWDTTRPVLLEKSPPNLLKTRYLQALFPRSAFVAMTRHPIAVALATSKWRRTTSLRRLVEHWLRCHEIYAADQAKLHRHVMLRYEDFVAAPQRTLDDLCAFVELSPHRTELTVESALNDRYFARWDEVVGRRHAVRLRRFLESAEPRANRFGYSLTDPRAVP